MSPYLIMLLLLVCAAVSAFFKPAWDKKIYYVIFAACTLFLLLRFGQGTDWLGYNRLYQLAPAGFRLDSSYFLSASVHGELGWKLIYYLFRGLGFTFFQFVFLVSVVEMVCLNRFITEFSDKRALSLVIAFPTLYLTYFFSSLREGLVIAIFLAFLLKRIIRKEDTVAVIVTILLLASVHTCALLFLVAVVAVRLDKKIRIPAVVASAVVGIILSFNVLSGLLGVIGISYKPSVSVAAIATRLIMVGFVLMLYYVVSRSGETASEDIEGMFTVYLIGIAAYFCLVSNSLVASRMAVPFFSIDVVLIPMLLSKVPKMGFGIVKYLVPMSMVVILVFCSGMTIKNIETYVTYGRYFDSITVLNYPYISCFNPYTLYDVSNSQYLQYLDMSEYQ